MKTHSQTIYLFLILFLSSIAVSAQEYDDLYFSGKDRKKIHKVPASERVTQDLKEVEKVAYNTEENYSTKNVNPEYIAKYQAKSIQDYESDSEFSDDEYFVEDYNSNAQVEDATTNFANNSNFAVRDRYGNVSYYDDYRNVYWSDPFLYQGTVFDPFYSPFRYGYAPMRSGWSMSIGYGWGNPWLGGYAWSTPYTGWRTSFSIGFGWGYGYNNWGYYDPWYSPYSYYGGYYGYGYGWGNNVVIINNPESRNSRVAYRNSRASSRSGDAVARRSRSVSSTDDNNGRSAGRTAYSSSGSGNYDDAQNTYYRRSRSRVSSSENGKSGSSSSRSYSNYTPSTRSADKSPATYRRSGNGNYSTPRSSKSYNSENSSSRSRSNYSTPSRSSRSSNYSTPSRSRSNNSSYSSPSRSRSSGYSSGSSSSGSRSSSGSSGSRSRRGGN